MVRGGNGILYLTEDALWFTILETPDPQTFDQMLNKAREAKLDLHALIPRPKRGVNLKLSFPGANPRPRLEPFNRLDSHISYLIGSDPAKWRTSVPVWGGVRYVDLYPGIDLEIMGQNGQLVQRLVVRQVPPMLVPSTSQEGGWRQNVRLRVDGADALALDVDILRLTTALGDFTLPLLLAVGADGRPLNLPAAQPDINGVEVTAPFALASSAFLLPSAPHLASPLASPLISFQTTSSNPLYATYLGGNGTDSGAGLAVDGTGNAYITGGTFSSNFTTTTGVFDPNYNGNGDAFVVKLNPGGTTLTYATFMGGGNNDTGSAIAVDNSGNAYVTGQTSSSNFFSSTVASFDTSHGGGDDAYVVKLNADGTDLIYAAYLGGSNDETGAGIVVDNLGNAYITGRTDSTDIFSSTVVGPDLSLSGSSDAFLVKVNPSGTDLVYATYLGGSDYENGQDVAIDGAGNAYVTGWTFSSDLIPPGVNGFDTTYDNKGDSFVTKIISTSGVYTYSYMTYLGGHDADDYSLGIAVDGAGNAYVTGRTQSSDFFTQTVGFDTGYNGVWDAFVAKLDTNGTGLLYGTYLGGSSSEYGEDIAVDVAGNAYVTGWTGSSSFFPPDVPGFDSSYNGGSSDAYVVKLNANGTNLVYATYLKGSSSDHGNDIAVDEMGGAYVTGGTFSSDFVPAGVSGYATSLNGGQDAFVTKLALGDALLTVDILDSQGNPVSALTRNGDGWPTPNPLEIRMTITNTTGATLTNPLLTLSIDSSINPSGNSARFYVLEINGFDGGVYNTPEVQYEVITNTQAISLNQTKIITAQVWIQPSVTTTLSVTVGLYKDFTSWSQDETLGQDEAQVSVPLAQIHPVVIVPGYVATWPPEHGGDLDPLQKSFDNLMEAMQRIGYELGEAGSGNTLIPFGWDWREPFGDTGRVILEADIDNIRDVSNHTKAYVDYDKVDIISHSAGGLVVRAFIEDATTNNQTKINKLITLGSPHRGLPAAYRGGRGGQYSAIFPGNSQIASGVVAGLIACDEGFLAGLDAIQPGGRGEEIALNEDQLYEFIKDNLPSAEDLLPTSDVTPAYLVDSGNPSVNYPYGNPPGSPPDNPFLEDMRTGGGDYDVSKLLVPSIISVYSSNPQAEGIYHVDSPPYGQGDDIRWGHGEVIAIDPVAGDGLAPTYSADLTQISALSGASNITTFEANNIYHFYLPAESSMVRRLITYVTGIDVVNNTALWTKAIPQPLIIDIFGQDIPIEAVYELVTCSPIRTLVTDPLGRRAGLNPDTGEIINEIPGAIVTKDGDEPHLIIVPRSQGQYQVKTTGIDNGPYTLGVFEIFSGTTQIAARVFTGTIAIGQSRQLGFDSSVFQEENGLVAMEAEHFAWQIGEVNRAWITQTVQVGYVGSGYLNAWPDIDQIYTEAFTTTSPQLEYTINFTTTGTYFVWVRGYTPNAAGDSVHISLDDQSAIVLTGLPPRQWAWANSTSQGNGLTFEVTTPGEHTLFLWQREDGLKLDRIVLTIDDSYNPGGNGPNESPRIEDD